MATPAAQTSSSAQPKKESQRAAWSKALIELGEMDPRVVVVGADTTGSLMTDKFKARFPDRLVNVGIAELSMTTIAAGLALSGKVVFSATFAVFGVGHVYNFIRQSIAYPKANVKIVSSHAGTTTGADGATHQMNEDVGLMCGLPNFTVVVPADAPETARATKGIYGVDGPCYMRISRENFPTVTENRDFRLGKADVHRDGQDVAIMANGIMVSRALEAAEELKRRGVDAAVINVHTPKPLDEAAVEKHARQCGAIVTAEEHTVVHGTGALIAGSCAKRYPVPMRLVGVQDVFGESGKADELLAKYGMTSDQIVKDALELMKKRSLAATGLDGSHSPPEPEPHP
jgi:transketolase